MTARHGFVCGLLAAALLLVLPPVAAGHGTGFFNPQLLVEPQWVSDHAERTSLRVVDFGRDRNAFDEGHIPGAVFVDMCEVTAEVECVPGILADLETVVEVLEEAGIGSATTVVVYDDAGGLRASRLFWILEYLGHDDVRLLNGGLDAWVDSGLELSTEAPAVEPGVLDVEIRPDRYAGKIWVLRHHRRPGVVILDVRSEDEFTGEKVMAERGGRIPGALRVEWKQNLTEDGVFAAPDELRELYETAGVTPDGEIVTYCQAGVRASHTYFALRLLGYPSVSMYDGSWAEWASDPDLPVESGNAEP